MEKIYVKNTFLTGYLGRLLLIRKMTFKLYSKHINSKSNSNHSILIDFVGKLYLTSINIDFVFVIMFSGHFTAELLQEQFLA